MPPPATPSPHRFLPPRETRVTKPSTLRNGSQVQQRTPTQTPRFALVNATEQAKPARRFAFATQARGDGDARTQTPKPSRKLQRIESINDASQEQLDEEGQTRVLEEEEDEDEEDAEILFAPSHHKRRRLSPPLVSTENNHSTPAAQPPSTPAPGSDRFLPKRTPAASAELCTQTPATRPAFLLPSHASPTPPLHPLPETFSPQRRGQKFVPGGLASTVRNWVMDVAHTASSANGSSYSKAGAGDGYRVKIRVSHVSTGDEVARIDTESDVDGSQGCMMLVHGSLDQDRGHSTGAEVRAILAGQSGRKSVNLRVRPGSVVGIRAPWWDVEIKGKMWIVGADWGVI